MVQKINTITDLFNNAKFKEYAPCFFEGYRTELSVATEKKISRITIDAFIKNFDKYIERNKQGPWYPCRIKPKLLADYFKQVLGLGKSETRLLLQIISDPDINNIIVKNNQSVDALVSKTVLIILSVDILASRRVGEKLSRRSGDIENIREYYALLRLFLSLAKTIGKEPNDEEITKFGKAARKFADENSSKLPRLVSSLKKGFPLVVYPAGLHVLMSTMFDEIPWNK
jgi:hypothetical protein